MGNAGSHIATIPAATHHAAEAAANHLDEPLLSIVVPAYNRAWCIERTLASIAAQEYRPLKVILVDNASTDNTRRVMQSWANANNSSLLQITVTDEHRRGAANARNRGLGLVTTPWVMFFDSDDEMLPWLTGEIARCHDDNPGAELILWDTAVPVPGRNGHRKPGCEPNTKPCREPRTKLCRASTSRPMYNNLVHGMMATLRYAASTALVRRAGGWNPRLSTWDDMEMGVRLLTNLQGTLARLARSGSPVIIHYSDNSITGEATETFNRRGEDALDACHEALLQAGMKKMLPWVEMRRMMLAADYHRAGHKEEAARLAAEVTARRNPLYRLIYLKHRLYTRGTHLLMPFKRGC